MPNRSFARHLPLLVILALLIALAAVYLPGVVRAWKFRSTVNALLADVRSGNLGAVPGYVLPEQRDLLREILARQDVEVAINDIASLKLAHYQREEEHIWASVVGRGHGNEMGNARLRWVWNGQRWELDVLNSYYALGPPSMQTSGTRIGDLVDGLELSEILR